MEWVAIAGIAAVLIVMALLEWPNLKRGKTRDKIAFVALTVLGGILAVLLVFDPELPGPSNFMNFVFKPLVNMLEAWSEKRSG